MNPSTPPAPTADANATAAQSSMTKAQAAKAVKRTVVELVDGKGEDGKPVKIEKTKRVPVSEGEVLSFKDYGSHVVVVTTGGQKLNSAAEA